MIKYDIKTWGGEYLGVYPKDIYRFLGKAVMNKKTKCYEWQGSLDTSGYGLFRLNGKLYKAHRLSFMLFKGVIPPNKIIMHKCDNPKCISLDHVRLGTSKENARDRDIKNRSNLRTRNNTHGMAKVTTKDILIMHEMLKEGYSRKEITERFPIKYAHVCKLLKEEMPNEV